MEPLDRLISLREIGLWSEGIGPHEEWDPVTAEKHQQRHNEFWNWIAQAINDECPHTDSDDYDDLILWWMTEEASERLERN